MSLWSNSSVNFQAFYYKEFVGPGSGKFLIL